MEAPGGEGGGREGGRGGGGGQTYVDHPEYGQLLFDDKDEWMRNLLQSLSAEAESNIPAHTPQQLMHSM